MSMPINSTTATIIPFRPRGSTRSGAHPGRFATDEHAPDTMHPVIDWRAGYHASAIEEERDRQRPWPLDTRN